MSNRIWLFLATHALIASCASVPIQQAPTQLDDYAGTYRVDASRILTGDLFDELDDKLLFFDLEDMDPSGDCGGVLHPVGPDRFAPGMPNGAPTPPRTELEFLRSADGTVTGVICHRPKRRTLKAERTAPHRSEPVTFSGDTVTLRGKLVLPPGKGPHPAIVLVHGSGPATRNAGPWNTFFTHLGYAVLSYDKRGAGESTGNWRLADFDDLAGDVIAAVDFLARRSDVDATRIGLHGSSQAGWVAPIAASRSSHVAFMIMRAAPGVPPRISLRHEWAGDFARAGLHGKEFAEAVDVLEDLLALAARGGSWEEMSQLAKDERETNWYRTAFGRGSPGGNPERWAHFVKTANTDPTDHVRKLAIPILWFLAERDENVPMQASLDALRAAFAAAGNDNAKVIVLPGADHAFFVRDVAGNMTYARGYFSRMADWLKQPALR